MTFTFDPSKKLWVEKYRPSTVADCILPERVKSALTGFINSSEFPSLMLSGSAGIGKTTVAKAICNQLQLDYILINASNERGIDVLRNQISQFATSVSFGDGKFKVVILDEFDYATPNLQTALRSYMEEVSVNCRFIITCNYKNKIIDPIHSRCAVIDLDPIKDEGKNLKASFMKRLVDILKEEGVLFEPKGVVSLVTKHYPDYRRTLNEAQRLATIGSSITEENVASSSVGDVSVENLIGFLKARDFTGTRNWVSTNSGMDYNATYRKLYDGLILKLQPSSIPQAIVVLADYQFKGVTTPDPELNFMASCMELMGLEFKDE